MADKKFWVPGGTRAANLINAYASCDTWSRENNRGGLGIEEFSADTLNLESKVFPEMNCKGADVKTICLWLATCSKLKLYALQLFCFLVSFLDEHQNI